jgi:hypothetical protein
MRRLLLIPMLLLGGCAGASFHQLSPTLQAKAAPEGAVYYLPKPYLLVARLPSKDAAPAGVARIQPLGSALNHRSLMPGSIAAGEEGTKDEAKDAPAKQELGSTDLSFGGATDDYVIKLVYLPDRSRPMKMSVSSGLFGSGSLKPTLQNGWMLTGFDATADSKFAEVLTAVASIITAQKGGGASGAEEDSSGGGSKAGNSGDVLRPGLYDFSYDEETGRLTRLCAISYFSYQGATPSGEKC